MILNRNQLLELIPHKDPFIMVDNLLSASENQIISEFKISSDNILCDLGSFSYYGLIENIAQSCAAGLGYIDNKSGSKPKIGYIGSVSKLVAYSKPQIGQLITTKIEIIATVESVVLVKGVSYLEDKELLECEMKIVIVE